MDENALLQLTAGGILALMILDRVFGLIKPLLGDASDGEGGDTPECTQKDCLRAIQADVVRVLSLVTDLHEWHSVRDPRGVFVWYAQFGNEELKETMKAMAENARAQTDVLKQLLDVSRETRAGLDEVRKTVGALETRVENAGR